MSLMSHSAVHSNVTVPAGLALGSIVSITALLVWLAGLILVLRGADPRDRPALLSAYAICRPPLTGTKRVRVHGPHKTPDCGCLNRHSVTNCPASCITTVTQFRPDAKPRPPTPGPAGQNPPRHSNIGQARRHQNRPGASPQATSNTPRP
jgi:hypothetical protein